MTSLKDRLKYAGQTAAGSLSESTPNISTLEALFMSTDLAVARWNGSNYEVLYPRLNSHISTNSLAAANWTLLSAGLHVSVVTARVSGTEIVFEATNVPMSAKKEEKDFLTKQQVTGRSDEDLIGSIQVYKNRVSYDKLLILLED